MLKMKEILCLKYVCGLSEREIAQSCRVTRSTVDNYLRRAPAAKVTWQMAEGSVSNRYVHVLYHLQRL